MHSRLGVLLVGLCALALALPAVALPEAGEFLVNRTLDSQQEDPVAAFGPGGVSLVVWADSRYGVRGQLFDAAGAKQGGALELVPNLLPAIPGEGPARFALEPTAVFLPGGNFVLAWAEERGYLQVAPFFQHFEVATRLVMTRRFRAGGEPAGPAFRISAGTVGHESWPKVHAVAGGTLLAVWRSDENEVSGSAADGLFTRNLSRFGRPRGAVFRLSGADETAAQYVALTQGAHSQALIAWEGCCDSAGDLGIFARVYDASSRTFGPLIQLNGEVAGRQRRPAIAPAGDGGFFALWQSELERSLIPIFGRFFDLAGRPVGGEFQVSHGFDTVQLAPGLATAPEGGYLAIWRDWLGPFFGISAVELDAAGLPLGDPVRIHSRGIQKSGRTSLATDGAGTFLVPYEKALKGRPGIAASRIESQ